jgi:hypothetical protein
MGTVPVAICIDEGCEAWKLPKWHFGHALLRKELWLILVAKDGPSPDCRRDVGDSR